MTRKKYRNLRKGFKGDATPIEVKRVEVLQEIKAEIRLTEEDRIGYIYKINAKRTVREITCVSYEVLFNNKWETIVYYDSTHGGTLHRHVRASINDTSDSPSTEQVRNKGTLHRRLTWCVEDIQNNFIFYKRRFMKRSKFG